MWLKKSQQRGEWYKRSEHKAGTGGDQCTEAFWKIIGICFHLSTMRSQTVKSIQALLIE